MLRVEGKLTPALGQIRCAYKRLSASWHSDSETALFGALGFILGFPTKQQENVLMFNFRCTKFFNV